jgi:hypothetical protein
MLIEPLLCTLKRKPLKKLRNVKGAFHVYDAVPLPQQKFASPCVDIPDERKLTYEIGGVRKMHNE